MTICEGLALNAATLFKEHLLELFCSLASDSCVNVRIQLSASIAKIHSEFKCEPMLSQTVLRLQVDSCRDVKEPVVALENSEATETLSNGIDIELFVRGMLD